MSVQEPTINLTPDQGLAFVEALTGLENMPTGQPSAKSPHARTMLATMLGQTAVPLVGDIINWHNKKSVPGYPQKLTRLVQYLRAVADSLEQILPREDQK